MKSLSSGKRYDWLSRLAREGDEKNHSKWTAANWEGLRKKHGDRIAKAVKQGCKELWRKFSPQLPHEKPVHSSVDHRVIVGLTGIQAAITDGELDISQMNESDTRLAARYAVNELNGFPDWFDELAKFQPQPVADVLCECVKGEWKYTSSQQDTIDVIHDIAWHGEGIADLVRDTITEELRSGDPPNLDILQTSFTVMMKSESPPLQFLGEIAQKRVRVYPADSPFFIFWMSIWLQTNSEPAIASLSDILLNRIDSSEIMIRICLSLQGDRFDRANLISNPDYHRTKSLRLLIPLVFEHVKPEDDQEHVGGYTPTPRDDAQDFRGRLLDILSASDNREADHVIEELLLEPSLSSRRDFLLHLLEQRRSKRIDMKIWEAKDVRAFAKQFIIEPTTSNELFQIALNRLRRIKHEVEEGEDSPREDLHQEHDEPRLRRWLARQLKLIARQSYTVPQEEEIDQQWRLDLRIENPKVDGPITIEIKWAHKWTLSELLTALEEQLVSQYLRDNKSKFGIYLLGYIGRKQKWTADHQRRIDWKELLDLLQYRANQIVAERSEVNDIVVLGIDFRDPRESLAHNRSNLGISFQNKKT